MKNINKNLGLIAITAFVFTPFSFILARAPLSLITSAEVTTSTQTTTEDESVNINANINGSTNGNTGTLNEQVNAQSRGENINNNKEDDNTKKDDREMSDKRTFISAAHRSVIASLVQNLLQVADREGGIGTQVKLIAQAQNDSNETTSTAITHVETRSRFKTFLIGTDYKNIGVLRSEMVKTDAQIKQLKALVEKNTNVTDKAVLEAQIQVLLTEQTNLNNFIASHKASFSLFGWLIKKEMNKK